MSGPRIIARCGDTKEAPESTLAAFKSAIDKGADAIEFDVHLTRDNKLVIHHDNYLGRTESASGFMGDYTFQELQFLDVGVWFDNRFRGTRMPTLEDVLALKNDSIRFEIDMRTPALPFLKNVIDTIVHWGVERQVELTSIHLPLLHHVKEFNPRLRTGIFFESFPEWVKPAQRYEQIISWLLLSDTQVAHLPFSVIDESLISKLHEKGLIAHGANLNSEEEIRRAVEMGIDQFSTDNLDLALKIKNI
jgi:glycerophosphoryl diester phosphodiesterase